MFNVRLLSSLSVSELSSQCLVWSSVITPYNVRLRRPPSFVGKVTSWREAM